ncbi:MAC/Perforin domain-containing protein [Orpheovirus IHUMI-LCC2]|uniref:MAC/Perforin domain-containing protein n=1 Tax=Orpheovirus IHUMI-LCC2 TaxID=2023057 RepID=A0A2I2L4X5_9VIRU|nr:MAC/Perforin domain-containing protein [Orpheovirus IHUMI-LCC2]SNW62560.1 MAC/Perforin domain-containing protein [Orpheovirus IHUMI-LCC2]
MKYLPYFIFIVCALSQSLDKTIERGVQHLGLGIDPLSYNTKLQIFDLQYTMKNPDTSGSYILPDYVVERDTPKNQLHLFSDVLTWSTNNTVSEKINVEAKASFWAVKGSFSYEHQWTRSHFQQTDRTVVVNTANMETKTLTLQYTVAPLSYAFNESINRIARLVEKNTTVTNRRAKYEINKLINDYGLVYVYKEVLGGQLKQSLVINTNKLTDSSTDSLKIKGGASFASYFSIKGSYQRDESSMTTFYQAVTDSKIELSGGAPWQENGSVYNWMPSVYQYPSVISLNAAPTIDLLTPERFPHIDPFIVQQMRDFYNEGTERYVQQNIVVGCMDPSSPKFSFRVNVNDPASCLWDKKFLFGGIYQTSSDPSLITVNELTQAASCPDGFDSYNIGQFSGSIPNTVCHTHYHWFHKHTVCDTYYTPISYNSYMCLAHNITGGNEKGFYFGGIYSNAVDNVITGAKRCPNGFRSYVMYTSNDKSGYLAVCVTPFDSGAVEVAMNFGGIFSSVNANPLTGNLYCPKGYQRHSLGFHYNGKEIFYCTGIHDILDALTLLPAGYNDPLPPYVEYLPVQYLASVSFKPNGTQSYLSIPFYVNDERPYHVQAQELLVELSSMENKPTIFDRLEDELEDVLMYREVENVNGKSYKLVIVLALVVGIFCVLIALSVVFLVKYRKYKKKELKSAFPVAEFSPSSQEYLLKKD